MKRTVLLFGCLGLFALVAVSTSQAQRLSWWLIERGIRADFPSVPQLHTDALAARLAHGESIVLLDVRTEAEYAVSHLAGARRIDPDAPDLDALAALPRNTPIVAYCSVGYRSSALVETLRSMGFTHAENLRGSIFRWANEGRPVVNASGAVAMVHPYNKTWGRLLHRAHRAQVPPVGEEGAQAENEGN